MADIIKGNWVASLANLRPAGIKGIKVKIPTDAAYYSLGNPDSGSKFSIEALTKPDTQLRKWAYGAKIAGEVDSIQAALQEIQLLDNLILKQPLGFKIELMDSLYAVTTTKLGLRWTLECGTDMDNFRRILYEIAGAIDRKSVV